MQYLVTGGAGFIGSNLAAMLLAEGKKVVIVDSLVSGTRENVSEAAVFYQEDVCDTDALRTICEKEAITTVVHLAALPRVQFSIEHPFEAQHVNVDGTLSVLEAARQSGVERVVFASSSSIYGDQEVMPLSEALCARPKSPYALHKFMGEELMKLWSTLYGIDTVSLRFFNVYGPRMDPEGAYALVIGKFLKLRKEQLPLTITGDGTQTRDFTHVEDVARAISMAAEAAHNMHGEVFNVGTGIHTTMNAIAEYIGGPVVHVPPRIEPKHTQADISKITQILGWEPKVSIDDGISALKKEYDLL